MNEPRLLMLPVLVSLTAALTLVGCDHRDGDTTTGAPESTAQRMKDEAKELQADASRAVEKAQESAQATAKDMKDAASNAADRAGDKVTDAVITASVNAELTKDQTLRATQIDVDTDKGRVALRGSAPDEASRQRATQLAMAVKGVTEVDNQLKIERKM